MLAPRLARHASTNGFWFALGHSTVVVLASVVGTTGLVSVLTQLLGPGFALTQTLGSLDLNILGVGAVVFFALVWATTTILRTKFGAFEAARTLV